MSTDATPGETDSTPSNPVQVEGRDELDALVDQHDVVLVDFYADWCGPCKMVEPIVERLAAETEAVVGKVDVDVEQSLAASVGVRGVPMMLVFADGEQVEELVGARPEQQLRSLVEGYLD